MSGALIVLSGPSGVGKGTVVSLATSLDPSIWIAPSMTTRKMRPNEDPFDETSEISRSKAYLFVDDTTFQETVESGGLIEWATYAGNRYGTLRAPVETRLEAGLPVLLEIEVQGADSVIEHMPHAKRVMLMPPSFAELARRLSGRGTDSETAKRMRLAKARSEMAQAPYYDHTIINDDASKAAEELVLYYRSWYVA